MNDEKPDYVADYREWVRKQVANWLMNNGVDAPFDWETILKGLDQAEVMNLFVRLHCGERDNRLPEAASEVFDGLVELR